ncbi:MAG: hypothetical protein OXC95_09010 [Dehalococcoidia bacterium]|nr:hypothetical protein [Dehalococcoidia bacterium]
MSMSIGVVRTEYLGYPGQAANGFARHLATEWDNETWRVVDEGHVFIEIYRDHMTDRATQYITSENLGTPEANEIFGWVRNLPWDRYTAIMLHFSF